MYLPEADQKDPSQLHMTVRYSTDPNFQDVLGLRMLRGRFIAESDRRASPAVVVIDDQLAREMFGDADPVGKRLKYGEPDSPVLPEVVGVVQHVKHYGLDGTGPVKGQSWIPAAQGYKGQSPFFRGETFIFVRYSGDPQTVIGGVRAKMAQIDPRQPLYNVQTYRQVLADATETQRITTSLLGVFAVIALVLASIGIYGVMSYSVTQRTHEIGVRMALGAKRGDVVRMVLSQSMRITFVGLVTGAVLALLVTRFMKALLFGVRANDPVVFAGITLLLAAVATLASFIPARRATKVDPMVALRYE
jgi:putative ABC transport system permease protein